MQRKCNRDINILGDQRDKDLSPEMRRRDKIQRVNEESQGVSLRPSRVVISETSTAADRVGDPSNEDANAITVGDFRGPKRQERLEGARCGGGAGEGQAKGSSDEE